MSLSPALPNYKPPQGLKNQHEFIFHFHYHNQIFSISSIHEITSILNLSLTASKIFTKQVGSYVKLIYFDDDESNMRDTPINDMLTKVGGTYEYEYLDIGIHEHMNT